jgi:hypothetical protein
LAVARAIDSDEIRNRIRDALERNDVDAISDVISSAELAKLPTATAILLASVLSQIGNTARAVEARNVISPFGAGDGAAIYVNGSRNVIPHQSGWRNRQNQFIRWPIAPWQYDAR